MFLSLSSFLLCSFFCFLLVSLLQAFMSCVDRQWPVFSSKCHVCMALSRRSFEGPQFLSNKTCSTGKRCGTNLPLLQIHNSLIRWKLIFFLKFSELLSKDLLSVSRNLGFKCKLLYSNSCNIKVSQLEQYVTFCQFSSFKVRD